MNWYVFSTEPEDADESLIACGSYREAVFEAQCRHDTQNRPERGAEGFYTLRGDNHSSHIATEKAMNQQGFANLLNAERRMKRTNLNGVSKRFL